MAQPTSIPKGVGVGGFPYFFFFGGYMDREIIGKTEVKIIHYLLVFVGLICFSKLSFDALLLGSLAIYLFQRQA
jgi:hypothetical protein